MGFISKIRTIDDILKWFVFDRPGEKCFIRREIIGNERYPQHDPYPQSFTINEKRYNFEEFISLLKTIIVSDLEEYISNMPEDNELSKISAWHFKRELELLQNEAILRAEKNNYKSEWEKCFKANSSLIPAYRKLFDYVYQNNQDGSDY